MSCEAKIIITGADETYIRFRLSCDVCASGLSQEYTSLQIMGKQVLKESGVFALIRASGGVVTYSNPTCLAVPTLSAGTNCPGGEVLPENFPQQGIRIKNPERLRLKH